MLDLNVVSALRKSLAAVSLPAVTAGDVAAVLAGVVGAAVLPGDAGVVLALKDSINACNADTALSAALCFADVNFENPEMYDSKTDFCDSVFSDFTEFTDFTDTEILEASDMPDLLASLSLTAVTA